MYILSQINKKITFFNFLFFRWLTILISLIAFWFHKAFFFEISNVASFPLRIRDIFFKQKKPIQTHSLYSICDTFICVSHSNLPLPSLALSLAFQTQLLLFCFVYSVTSQSSHPFTKESFYTCYNTTLTKCHNTHNRHTNDTHKTHKQKHAIYIHITTQYLH